MNHLVQHPHILLHVIDFLDVPTLLSLRLVSKTISSLIISYESSISRRIAKNLCPKGDEDTLDASFPSTLKDLVPFIQLSHAHELATKAVASDQIDILPVKAFIRGIASEDDLGSEIRQRVKKGLMVMFQLSLIARNVQSNHSETRIGRVFQAINHQTKNPSPFNTADEERILIQWTTYISSLSDAEAVDFSIAYSCVRSKIASDFRSSGGSRLRWGITWKSPDVYKKLPWLTSSLFRKGSGFIKDLWSEDHFLVEKARVEIQTDIGRRSSKSMKLESATLLKLMASCNRKYSDRAPHMFKDTKMEADCYWRSTFACRIGPSHLGLPPDQLLLLRRDAAISSAFS